MYRVRNILCPNKAETKQKKIETNGGRKDVTILIFNIYSELHIQRQHILNYEY